MSRCLRQGKSITFISKIWKSSKFEIFTQNEHLPDQRFFKVLDESPKIVLPAVISKKKFRSPNFTKFLIFFCMGPFPTFMRFPENKAVTSLHVNIQCYLYMFTFYVFMKTKIIFFNIIFVKFFTFVFHLRLRSVPLRFLLHFFYSTFFYVILC